jgi:signal transduction histidine kinase
MTCLRRELPAHLPTTVTRGDAECGPGIHWIATLLDAEALWLIVAVQEVLLQTAVKDAIQRQLVLLLALSLTVAAALAIGGRLQQKLDRSERFAMVGRLSGGLAHELGSPLSVIGMRASAIANQMQTNDAAREHAQAITREVERVTAFIQGLLHLSRRQRIELARVDVTSLLQSVIADVLAPTESLLIEVDVTVPPAPVHANADAALLYHGIRNVLRNAVQAVATRPSARRLSIAVTTQLRTVYITVADNGPGIPAEHVTKVFDPFFTTKPVSDGMGLGLAISRGVIREHGGNITVENQGDGGARVTIRLPRLPQ